MEHDDHATEQALDDIVTKVVFKSVIKGLSELKDELMKLVKGVEDPKTAQALILEKVEDCFAGWLEGCKIELW